MLPQITSLRFEPEDFIEPLQPYTTMEWDFALGDFVITDGRVIDVTGLEYIKIWVEKILRTRKGLDIYPIYGSGHHGLIGTIYDRDFVQAEVARYTKDALLLNNAITEVSDISVEFDGAILNISLKINTVYGVMEVNI